MIDYEFAVRLAVLIVVGFVAAMLISTLWMKGENRK